MIKYNIEPKNIVQNSALQLINHLDLVNMSSQKKITNLLEFWEKRYRELKTIHETQLDLITAFQNEIIACYTS